MREPVRDRDRLEHMVEAITNILEFADGKKQEEIEVDKLRYNGIVKNIEIIGEAAYKLTNAFRCQHTETPWEFIMKMRHVLVHDYYQISPKEVWIVIQMICTHFVNKLTIICLKPIGTNGRKTKSSSLRQQLTRALYKQRVV